jgi:hypothetical protein
VGAHRLYAGLLHREVISWVATTGGVDTGHIRDLMIQSVEQRFGLVNRLPVAIE